MPVAKRLIEWTVGRAVQPAGDEKASPRDGHWAAVTSGGPDVTDGESSGPETPSASVPRAAYGWIALAIALTCAVNALSAAQDEARSGAAYDLSWPALWEASSGLVVLALLPLVQLAVTRGRRCSGWRAAVAIAIPAAFGLSALHILGMVGLRKLAYAALGGSYHFHWDAELLYELRKDLLSFSLIGAALWLLSRPRRSPASPQPEPPGGEPAITGPELWLRDGANRIRIDGREVVWVGSAGNYVEFRLKGARHLVRGTLGREEERLFRFGIVRIHRTRLVNRHRITAIEPRPSGDFVLRLETGETVLGSRRYKQAVAGIDRAPVALASPEG